MPLVVGSTTALYTLMAAVKRTYGLETAFKKVSSTFVHVVISLAVSQK